MAVSRVSVARPDFAANFRGFVTGSRAALGRRWQLLLVLAVGSAGGAELLAHFNFANAAPALQAWQAIRPRVVSRVQPGTLIVVSPRWAEPNARWALGDALMPIEDVARADASRFAEALEISILGSHSDELAGWQLRSEDSQGAFVFRSWTNPDATPVLYDFLAHTRPPDLVVNVVRSNDVIDNCAFATNQRVSNGDLGGHPTFPKRRFKCGGPEWSFVGLTIIEDHEYRPRRCIWAHPLQRGVLSLRYDPVPLGSTLRGYAGLPYLIERERHGAPIDVSVEVAGEPIGSFRHADGDGWKRFQFSTERFRGQALPVEFLIVAKREVRRELCFQADTR